MNKCIFMGRLTRDPEIRYTQSETEKDGFMQMPEGEELPFN